MIIVTAGHVDHGKTTLIQALTGTDTDRLPEEKRRGMTIDLGYAFLNINKDERIAFIDVPGHEKFINNMLTGVGNAKHAMLVIACDDGVMPQTKEHLDILNILPLESLTLVLTKCDIASSSQIEHTQNAINQLLNTAAHLNTLPRSFFAVSSKSRAGIAELKNHLIQLAHNDISKPNIHSDMNFRMNIDRVFTVKGAGIVVTGTVLSGEVSVDDKLYCSSQSSELRVRSIHAQGKQTTLGKAGERVALNLVGSDNHRSLERGDWLTFQKPLAMINRVTAVFSGTNKPQHWQSVHCHHGARHCLGRIVYLSPLEYQGETAKQTQHLIELQLDKALSLTHLDTLVIRDANGKNTLGGASVIELTPPARAKRKPERIDYLSKLALTNQANIDNIHNSLFIEANYQSVNLKQFSWQWQINNTQVTKLANQQGLHVIGEHIIHPQKLAMVKQTLLDVVTQYHKTHEDELGLGRSRLQRMSHSILAADVLNFAIDELCSDSLLQTNRGLIHLPQHQLCLSESESKMWQQIQAMYSNSGEPLWISDFSKQLNIATKDLKGLFYKLVQLGYLTSVVKDRYVQTKSLYEFANRVRHYLTDHEVLETAEFRTLINMGRKVSIQLLELFDRVGFTQRKYRSSSRTIRDAEMFTEDI